VKGRWTCLYRAVDKQGRTVDFLLSERCDVAAVKRLFHKALQHQGTPRVITLDAYPLKAAGMMPHRVRIRCSSYLNNVVEQDHRPIKHEFDRCLDSNDSKRQPSQSAASSLQRRFENTSSKQESYREDPKRLQRFGRLYWPPDLAGVLPAESSPSKQFAPEPLLRSYSLICSCLASCSKLRFAADFMASVGGSST
jgi:hypothetical protein